MDGARAIASSESISIVRFAENFDAETGTDPLTWLAPAYPFPIIVDDDIVDDEGNAVSDRDAVMSLGRFEL